MMKRQMIIGFMTMLVFVFSTTLKTDALTFEQLPVTQTSKQWSIELGQGKGNNSQSINSQSTKPQQGVSNNYSIAVKSIGKDVKNVRIEVFRDEPNSTTKYELFTAENLELLKDGEPFLFSNFPLSENAKKLEITITWTEGSARKLKETFVFAN
ncbi:MAG TPA: hypothetical protein VNM45_19335 [Bacillus sp. (in: firmicutes)]|nr:hypothetical protein [Bacillus sp. (in: firmicutes)]